MELFTATGKLRKVFDNYRCSICAPRVTRHTSIRYSSSCHTHASTWVHRYSSLLQWSVPVGPVLSVGGSFTYFARNARCTVTTDLLCDIPTHKTTSSPERPFSHYIHSHRLAAEMWTTMKNNLLGGKILSYSFCLYRFCKYVSYGFPIINLCNPGVHYETPCIIIGILLWQHVSIILLTILRPASTSKKYITQYALIVPLSYESKPEDVLKKDRNILP